MKLSLVFPSASLNLLILVLLVLSVFSVSKKYLGPASCIYYSTQHKCLGFVFKPLNNFT